MPTLEDLSFGVASGYAVYFVFKIRLKFLLLEQADLKNIKSVLSMLMLAS